jgi:hypothetical protein
MNHDKVQPGDLFLTHDYMCDEFQLVLRVDEKKDIIDVFSSNLGKVEQYRSTWFRGCEKVC